MAFDGFFQYGPTEIVNVSRALAYARNLGMPWVKDVNDSPYVRLLLGDVPYTTPAADLAPWYDPMDSNSAEFIGLIPLEVNGIEDSTRESSVFEYTVDGGNPGRIRHATKSVVFSVALVGKSEAAVEYGFRWLKRALVKRECVTGDVRACEGQDLTYMKAMPWLEGIDPDAVSTGLDGGVPATTMWPQTLDGGAPSSTYTLDYSGGTSGTLYGAAAVSAQWWGKYGRYLRNVKFNRGPVVTGKRRIPGCEGVVWMVSFTATAGDAFEYGISLSTFRGLGDGTSPWSVGVAGAYGNGTYVYTGACPAPIYTPIFDPVCAALLTPPPPPDVAPSSCYSTVTGTWDRWYADVPASVVPLWDEVRPIFTISAGVEEARMLKIRVYDTSALTTADCNGLLAEYVIQYLPANMKLVIDTVRQAVYAYDANGYVRRADSLVFSANAKPIKYVGLSCGVGYRVTVEREGGNLSQPLLDLDLVSRTA